MILTFLIISFMLWVILQATNEKNHPKWQRRFEPMQPVARQVIGDIRATRILLWGWPERLRTRWEMWRELRRFKKLREI